MAFARPLSKLVPSPLSQRREGQGEGFGHSPLILTFSPARGGEGTQTRRDPART